jgi:hypothetical protein
MGPKYLMKRDPPACAVIAPEPPNRSRLLFLPSLPATSGRTVFSAKALGQRSWLRCFSKSPKWPHYLCVVRISD